MILENIFACPSCQGKLENSYQQFVCSQCSLEYPVAGEVPVFLTGEVSSDSMNEYWDQGWENRFNETDHSFLKNESARDLKERIKNEVNSYISNEEHPMLEVLPINDKVLLNVGCGLKEALHFTLLGAQNYIGVDYSYNASRYSLENIKKLDGTGITAQANAEKLPIRNETIDIAYSYGVLHHTPETQVTLDEIFRVLKPNGKGIIGLYNTWSPKFIFAHIIGTIKSFFVKSHTDWYQETEGAWRTDETLHPWTKSYSLRELRSLFSKYSTHKISFRRTGFDWANAIPKIGQHIGKTKIGKFLVKNYNPGWGQCG